MLSTHLCKKTFAITTRSLLFLLLVILPFFACAGEAHVVAMLSVDEDCEGAHCSPTSSGASSDRTAFKMQMSLGSETGGRLEDALFR